ncbi:MAG: hypothetical protein P1U53_04530 [Sulfitobacter sp.]|nr:hypothetical protein [Sulfitobacter sp.]
MAGPAQAQTYQSVNFLTVVPLGGGDFEVIEDRGEGARGLWCAAADYALRRGAARANRLYVKTPRGPSVSGVGRTGVVFTLDESRLRAEPYRSYSVSVNVAGENLPLHHAYQFCKDYQIEPDDILFRERGHW